MVVIAGAMARFTFPNRSKNNQSTREPSRGRSGAQEIDLDKLRFELQKARCRVGALPDGEPPKLYPTSTDSSTESDRRRSRSCTDPIRGIAELPGSEPIDIPSSSEAARPVQVYATRSNTDSVAIPKRRSSRALSDKYGLPSGVRAKRRLPRSIITEKALPETPDDGLDANYDASGLTEEESAELLALEKQFGLHARGRKPSKEDKLKRISKLQSVLGVPIPEIPHQDSSHPTRQSTRKEPRKESSEHKPVYDAKRQSKDFASSVKKKKDRHLDLMEVNRALRDASNITYLRDQIDELQKDLAERNAMISRYTTLENLQSRYSSCNPPSGHIRGRSMDSDYESTPYGSEGSRNSLERSSGGESPSSNNPPTPSNETDDRRFARNELSSWWTHNSSHDGYTSYVGHTPALGVDDTIPEETSLDLVPSKHEPVELEAPVPVPSAVMKVVDINEQWADIECIDSPEDATERASFELDAPLPPLKSARRLPQPTFAELPEPQKALYEAIEDHLRRNSEEVPTPAQEYEVESPEMYAKSFAQLSADSSPEQPSEEDGTTDGEQSSEEEDEEEDDKETDSRSEEVKVDLACLPFADGPTSPISPISPVEGKVQGLGITF